MPAMNLTDQIREELRRRHERGESLYALAKDSGVAWSTLRRFLDGGGLRSDQLDKLWKWLGWRVRKR